MYGQSRGFLACVGSSSVLGLTALYQITDTSDHSQECSVSATQAINRSLWTVFLLQSPKSHVVLLQRPRAHCMSRLKGLDV